VYHKQALCNRKMSQARNKQALALLSDAMADMLTGNLPKAIAAMESALSQNPGLAAVPELRAAFLAGGALARANSDAVPPAAQGVFTMLASSPAAPSGIKAIRKATGLTQTAFAKRIGYDPAAVCDWERGKTPVSEAALAAILRLAGKAGVDLNCLPRERHQFSGRALRTLRSLLGLTRAEIGELLGLSENTVRTYETRVAGSADVPVTIAAKMATLAQQRGIDLSLAA
jgi:transcriptional regulator with XRE-family HTH domain